MVTTSEDEAFSFTPEDLPVAKFYHRLFEGLGSLGIEISLNPISFDLDENKLDADTYHRTCNQGHVRRFHRALVRVDRIFEEFAGRFNGKTSPVHLFWHSFDLAVTRFSDRRVSLLKETDPVTSEPYSTRSYLSGSSPETKTYASLPSTLTLRPSPRA